MCSAPSIPSMPQPKPVAPPAPMVAPQQAPPPTPLPPPPKVEAVKSAPLPPQIDAPTPAPPPQLTATGGPEETPTVSRPKSKRAQQQQAASGTSALRIPLNTGETSKKSNKTAGLNI